MDSTSLTPLEVAELLKITKNTVYEIIKRGELPAYKVGKKLRIDKEDIDNYINISITDFAGGLPKEVQDRLFKEMVTTKGKNGTGLGLYMSYSNIKAHFGGDITYKTEDGKGTTFNVIIPINRQ